MVSSSDEYFMQVIFNFSDFDSARLNYSLGVLVPVLQLNLLIFKNSIKNQFNLVDRLPANSSIDPTSISGSVVMKWVRYILIDSFISFCMSVWEIVVLRLNFSSWLISSSSELRINCSNDWSIAMVKQTSMSTDDRQISLHSFNISSISVSKEKRVRNHLVVKYSNGS